MTARTYRWQLAGLLLLTWACMACNPVLLPFFLMGGMDPQFEPEFKLVGEDKKKPVKLVVLCSTPAAELRPELIGADKELAAVFSRKLQEGFNRNKQHIIIASPNKVQKYKDEHPLWATLSLEEIGKQLDTDLIIDLEINHLSLYENGSQNTLFRGKAAISVTVADMRRPGENPVFTKEYVLEYPTSQGPLLASDTNPQKFRRDFLNRIAMELTWYFVTHSTAEHHTCE